MRVLRVAILVAAVVAACSDVTAPPSVESVDVLAPAGLAQPLRIRLDRAAAVTVVYQAEGGGPRLRVDSPPAREHTVLLTRLRAAETYAYEVVGTGAAGAFATGPLPPDLAALDFTATGTPTVPLVLVHLFGATGFRGYAIVDAAGEVVWWWRTVDFPFGASRRANGNFVFMDKGRGLVEVTAAGEAVREVPQDVVARELHHDAIATPRNTVLFIAFDPRLVDGERVLGEAIWEWTPETGGVEKRWSAWDHLSPVADRGSRFGLEWMHANALALGARGNVLLSVHYFDQVLSLSPDFGAIEWRLGGVNATVPLAVEDRFSGQHTPGETAPNRVLLFDNGLVRNRPSRALELQVVGSGAVKVWEWSAPNANYAAAVSSARRLPNGNTVIAFGMSEGSVGSSGPTEVYEVSGAGESIWRLVVTGTTTMFRAEPLLSVGVESVVR
jgi:hypothetical protein